MTIRVVEGGYCKMLIKKVKAHDRSVVGLEFVRDPISRKLVLISLAHDSIKIWNVVVSEDGFEIFEKKTITAPYCGIQSYDMTNNSQIIALVGVESTIHTLKLDQNYSVAAKSFNKGIMEAWHIKILDEPSNYFTVSFSGLLRIVRQDGEWVRQNAFEKVRTITTVAYSGTFIAVGNSHGLVHIIDPNSLSLLFTIEAHSMKIRCVQFTPDDSHILTGSDDKTIKLFSITESKGTLLRTFYGHRRSITAIDVERCSGGERFASAALDNRIILWETATGTKIHVFDNSTADFSTCVKFSPDGRFIVTATDESTILAYSIPRPDHDVVMEEEEETVGPSGIVIAVDEQMDTNGAAENDEDEINNYFGGSISPTSPPAPVDVEMVDENIEDQDQNNEPNSGYDITLPGETTLDSAVHSPLSLNASMFNDTIVEENGEPSTSPHNDEAEIQYESQRPSSNGGDDPASPQDDELTHIRSDEKISPPPRPQYGGIDEADSPY